MKRLVLGLGLLCVLVLPAGIQAEDEARDLAGDEGIPITSHVFGDLPVREIGPAIMSGRISALDVVDDDPRIMFVGTAGGGVWRSRDGGISFAPVFDEHCQSIGCVTIDQARPDTIWVGTGESWVRNSVSVGDGIYRSTDGGRTWEHKGLPNSERIAEIIIHPENPEVVYAAVLGPLWSAGQERGLYRTTDGGQTWEKILYVDDTTGCNDIAIDPQEPDIMYAAMWQFRRAPDFFTSGGPGSGLHKSMDGGRTWRKIQDGLPQGDLGRIAIAVMPSRPSVLYAAVESGKSGFYRSDDLGESWRLTTTEKGITGRPFYFQHLVPDPRDHERVYKMNTFVQVSTDGGENFQGLGGRAHADGHAMWIDPHNPRRMVLGTDGGIYISQSRGSSFRHVANLPVSQFYRVSVDDHRPFRVYGGLQDNGSWCAPSRSEAGIENRDWENLGGGDGFAVVVDTADEDIVYWEWQGGNIRRQDRRTGEDKDIKPLEWEGGPELRWHWNTPIVVGNGPESRLYVGSQFLHRSTDRGDSWEVISPDLTTNNERWQRQAESGGLTVDNTTAENHCTIFSIAESPLNRNIIWVGTDDGNLQVTGNGGRDWRLTNKDLAGLPAGTWVSCVEASRHNPNEAFATFDGHRRGDMRPHVYHTVDMGRSWTRLATAEIQGHAHVIRQDPVNADLLFLGTEKGLFISLDRGRHWARFAEHMPPVGIRDMAIQARASALVMGTHGRGIWIMDDLEPLRNLTRENIESGVALLASRPAEIRVPRGRSFSPGDEHYAAPNPDSDAVIAYYLQKRHLFGEMKIEIFTPEGELLTTLPGGKRKGLNFVTWSPRLKPPKVAPSPVLDPSTSFAAAVGPPAPEGVYTYRLTKGKRQYEGSLEVRYAPDYPHDPAERAAQQKVVDELYGMLARLAYVAEAAVDLRDAARQRADTLGEKEKLARKLRSFADEVDAFHSTLMVTEDVQGIPGVRKLREKVVRLYAAIAGFGGAPTESQVQRLAVFRKEIAAADGAFGDLTAGKLAKLNKGLQKKGLAPLELLTREAFAERER
ncbi:glycosyl hydrolase [bacterium DOLJORAL78_65_58]|nr:MAG: glycosyl hydrolase [bacterium DOLZORAL124_64_63]PIE75680.1 MAG: glycosyl hydrolase [bacterium DOLJORAL78_65_58]